MHRVRSIVVAAVLLTATSQAYAGDTRQECVSAAERAQQLRDERSFLSASRVMRAIRR